MQVTRPIPAAFCGDGFPFAGGASCTCLEFDRGALPLLCGRRIALVDGYPSVHYEGTSNFMNLYFLGHPKHGSRATGYVAVHRCHNPSVRGGFSSLLHAIHALPPPPPFSSRHK